MEPPSEDLSQREFTAEQRERIIAALVATFGKVMPACFMCKSTSWRIAKELLLLMTSGVDPAQFQFGGVYVSVGLICQVCGNTVLLDSDKLGLGDLIGGTPIEGDSPEGPLGR